MESNYRRDSMKNVICDLTIMVEQSRTKLKQMNNVTLNQSLLDDILGSIKKIIEENDGAFELLVERKTVRVQLFNECSLVTFSGEPMTIDFLQECLRIVDELLKKLALNILMKENGTA